MSAINREQWLTRAVAPLAKIIAEAGVVKEDGRKVVVEPDKIAVSCSFPGGGNRKTRIGECWPKAASKGTHQIFVTPTINDPHRVLDILLHELCHAADNNESQHHGPFVKVIRAVGFEGKPTATVAGEALAQRLAALADKLGPYPHTGLDASDADRKTQTTRMLKVECERCGCIVRMTAKWLDEAGEPTCGCGGPMIFVPSEPKRGAK